ncbi:hypothetical protein [Rhodovulum sp.]|uniref:hypothetical protein n=1 Tax=Rhodovulum sp. TaxID=34009 RepID=UPI0017F7852D|nr:hypothetical protein [Rhodovulum sp.]HDR29210.1 hypothetical protein [Rhodovulum sp.]
MAWAELFGPAMLGDLVVALATIGLGIWLPGLVALRRLRSRHWWEKKAGFYQDLVATLGRLKQIEDAALQHESEGGAQDAEAAMRTAWDHEEARQRLRGLANEGLVLMSPEIQEAIRRYFHGMDLARGKDSAVERQIERATVTNDALVEVIAAARKDLGVRG